MKCEDCVYFKKDQEILLAQNYSLDNSIRDICTLNPPTMMMRRDAVYAQETTVNPERSACQNYSTGINKKKI